VIVRIQPWLKASSYLGLASLSCLLFSAYTPPLLTPKAAASLPLIGGLAGDLPGYWARFILSFLLLGLLPAALALAFREKPADLGLKLRVPLLRRPLFWLLIPAGIAVGAIGAAHSALGSYYPYSQGLIARVREAGLGPFLGHFTAYFFLYYIPWEFFFRGFLLLPFALAAQRAFARNAAGQTGTGLQEGGGEAGAAIIAALVLFQTLPSTLLHFGHPMSELLGAVVGGVAFGILAWKTRSIVPGLLIHAAMGLGTDGYIVLKGAGLL
jgi:membrane protease YdiL (CAAX protease family)